MLEIINQFDIPCGTLRDYLFVLRFLTVLLPIYLAILMGKRIREAGKISGTTGFTLYLIGSAIYQYSITNLVFYDEWEYKGLIYIIASFIYLTVMGLYSFFSEMDQKKHPVRNATSKFAFPWTVFSGIGIVLFFILGIIDYTLLNLGFIYMLIPFISSTSRFMDRFHDLELLKADQPWRWFYMGLAMSGFSNFIFSFQTDIVFMVLLQGSMVILGVFFMTKGWNHIPALAESDWYMNLSRLLIVQRVGSLVLYSYAFQSTKKAAEKGEQTDDNLTGGALSGIQSLLGEILASEQTINEIDHGDKTIYFKHGEYVSVILITTGKAQEYHMRLRNFVQTFEAQFEKELKEFVGNITAFYKTDPIVKTYFMHRLK